MVIRVVGRDSLSEETLFRVSGRDDPKSFTLEIEAKAATASLLVRAVTGEAMTGENRTDFRGEILWDTSKPDGTPKKQLDVSRLATLGWQARVPLEEGLAHTVALFRKQLSLQLARL